MRNHKVFSGSQCLQVILQATQNENKIRRKKYTNPTETQKFHLDFQI